MKQALFIALLSVTFALPIMAMETVSEEDAIELKEKESFKDNSSHNSTEETEKNSADDAQLLTSSSSKKSFFQRHKTKLIGLSYLLLTFGGAACDIGSIATAPTPSLTITALPGGNNTMPLDTDRCFYGRSSNCVLPCGDKNQCLENENQCNQYVAEDTAYITQVCENKPKPWYLFSFGSIFSRVLSTLPFLANAL